MGLRQKIRECIRTVVACVVYFSGVALLRAYLLRRKGPLVRILLIHHIKDTVRFERMMSLIARTYHPISFQDLVTKNLSKDRINVLLTFDDGYESWYTRGIPVLEKYRIPAVFFVSSGFVEASVSDAETERFCRENLKLSWVSKPLTKEQLKKCAEHPLITIGGHTRSHPFLATLGEDAARKEVEEDKKVLEEIIGKPVSVFAYPFGNYTGATKTVVSEAGYSFAVTTKGDFLRKGNEFALPRSNHGTVSPLTLRMWIGGAYDFAECFERFIVRIRRAL